MKRHLLAYAAASILTVLSFCLLNAEAGLAAVVILDNGSGGQCSDVGTWNGATKTCTLTQDISQPSEALYTLSVLSDDVTVDGNGHTLEGPSTAGTSNGVYLSGVKGVTVKNLTIRNYNKGVALADGATSNKHNVIKGNSFSGNWCGISVASSYNDIEGNTMEDVTYGIDVSGSNNAILYNRINPAWIGINLNSGNSTVTGNTIAGTTYSLFASSLASSNYVYANNFLGIAADFGSNNSFSISYFSAHWGNHWDDHDAPGEGCSNASFDDFCDEPRPVPGTASNQDAHPFILRNGWNRYDFTWYDNVGGSNWILVANPAGSEDVWADLTLGGEKKPLPLLPGNASGQVSAGKSVAAMFPGLVGGPVEVDSRGFQKTIVSERTLWPSGGNSIEEVPGTWAYRMSDTYWWPWYDMLTPGFKNWVLVSNPNSFAVDVEISLGSGPPNSISLAPGAQMTPATFQGQMGGPLKVRAFVQGTLNPAKVMASQRVLSNNDMAFNEVPGTPDSELSSHYVWTWYDMTGDARNWVLIANPPTNAAPIYYDITIAGDPVAQGEGPIAVGDKVTPFFPGRKGGPVEVKTYYTPGNPDGSAASSIASQRSVWGPSFEEVPGMRFDSLSSTAYWTWYDQLSSGVSNWVLVANPSDTETITATVSFINQADGQGVFAVSLPIGPGGRWTPQFAGKMGGPVKVTAAHAITSAPADVIASQRVLWSGYFNEVWGQ